MEKEIKEKTKMLYRSFDFVDHPHGGQYTMSHTQRKNSAAAAIQLTIDELMYAQELIQENEIEKLSERIEFWRKVIVNMKKF
jgi:hypothetical protein